MLYADGLAKLNHFFGTQGRGGIYSFKTVSSKFLSPSTPRYLLLTWVFLDVNDTRSDLLPELTSLQSKLFIIFITFPQSEQWKPLMTNTIPIILVMNPWTWDEMNKA
jgi:hypothetical protein